MGETFGIVGSTGELELYHDPYGGITPEVAQKAEHAELEIIKRRDKVEQSFLEMAFLLDDFEANEYYRARGYPSFKTWTEDPSVEIGYRVAADLLRITREVMPVLEQTRSTDEAIATIANAKISKTRALLPLLSEGKDEEFVELLDMAPEMTLRDLNREVRMIRSGDDENGDLRPAVFKAYVRRGDKRTRYKIIMLNGQITEDVGTLSIPNEYTSRWTERFGRFLEFELED